MDKKKLLIIGAGGLGRMTLDIVGDNYDCFFADDAFQINEIICGTRVIGKISELYKLTKTVDCCVVALGDNALRESITKTCKRLGFEIVSAVSPNAFVSRWAKVGNGCIIMPYATVQNNSSVGDGTVLCSHVEIHHDSKVGNFCVIYPNSVVRTYAELRDKVKCGSNVSIGNDVVIFENSVLDNGQTFNK